MKRLIEYENNPIKRFILRLQTLRVHWTLGRVKNPILNKILDIYYSIRFPGEIEGIIEEKPRIWKEIRKGYKQLKENST